MRDSKPLGIPTLSTKAAGPGDQKDRTKPDNRACRQGATSQTEVNLAIKGTSMLLTAQCIQDWSKTSLVTDNGPSETLLADTKSFLEEEIHFVMSEHSILQTEENLNYSMTEM